MLPVKRIQKEPYCPWKINPDPVYENGRQVAVDCILREQDYFFKIFCFGEYFSLKNTEELMKQWNQDHWHELQLVETDDMQKSFEKMKKFYVPKFLRPKNFTQF